MSNLVETVAFTGDTPWHGLGFKVDPNADLEVWKEQCGFNFEVLESGLRRDTDDALVEGSKSLYRSDTGENLAVVKKDYNVVQPGVVLGLFREFAEERGFQMHTAGTLMGGCVFWALAKTGLTATIANDEHVVAQFVLLASSADRSLSTVGHYTVIEDVCNNTLQLSPKGKSSKPMLRVKHSRKFDVDKAKQTLLGLNDHEDDWKVTVDILRRLSEIKVVDPIKFYKELLAKDTDSDSKEYPRIVETLKEIYEGTGPGQASIHSTAYGLVNSVSRYIDFYRGRRDDNRLFNAFFGPGSLMKNRAVDMALQLAA